jgi:hypothetical protein
VALSDNMSVAGTTTLDNTTITGTLAVSDAVTLSDNLSVAGTTSLDNATITGTLAVSDAVTLSDNLSVAGATSLDNTSITGTLGVSDAVTLSNSLAVAGTTILSDNLTVTGTSNLADTVISGALNISGLTTLDNASITTLNVSGNSQLTGNVTVGGTLSVTGLASFSEITADNATIGTIYTDTIKSADGQTDIIRAESDGTVHIGENSLVFDSSNDVISSSSGLLTLGDSNKHVTKVRGILSIQDPTDPDHAATRRYVDQSAAMAAALDTRNPHRGKSFHVQLGGASKNQENAIGLNFAGSMFLVNAPGTSEALPFSISAGVSSSADQYMGKLSVGLSW